MTFMTEGGGHIFFFLSDEGGRWLAADKGGRVVSNGLFFCMKRVGGGFGPSSIFGLHHM